MGQGDPRGAQSVQGWEGAMGVLLVAGARASPSSLGPQAVLGGWGHTGQSRCVSGGVMMALARTIWGTLVSMHEGQHTLLALVWSTTSRLLCTSSTSSGAIQRSGTHSWSAVTK